MFILCPDGTADLRDLRGASLDDHRMDHSRTVSWDPGGIADSRTLSVCYDCLCLMTLFQTVMYLARYWAAASVWAVRLTVLIGRARTTRLTSRPGKSGSAI